MSKTESIMIKQSIDGIANVVAGKTDLSAEDANELIYRTKRLLAQLKGTQKNPIN